MKTITITLSKSEMNLIINALGCYAMNTAKEGREKKTNKIKSFLIDEVKKQAPWE